MDDEVVIDGVVYVKKSTQPKKKTYKRFTLILPTITMDTDQWDPDGQALGYDEDSMKEYIKHCIQFTKPRASPNKVANSEHDKVISFLDEFCMFVSVDLDTITVEGVK